MYQRIVLTAVKQYISRVLKDVWVLSNRICVSSAGKNKIALTPGRLISLSQATAA